MLAFDIKSIQQSLRITGDRQAASIALAVTLFLIAPLVAWVRLSHDADFPDRPYYILSIPLTGILIASFLYSMLANKQVDFEKDQYDKKGISIVFFYSLLALSIGMVFNLFTTTPVRVGLPFGHGMDWFQSISLSITNNYTDITKIGYLPGLLGIAKVTSLFFTAQKGQLVIDYWGWFLYAAVMSSALLVFIRPALRLSVKEFGLPLAFVLLTSYPFLLEVERGNWVIASAITLALVVQNFSSGRYAIPVALYATMKVLNIVFCPLFILQKNFRFAWCAGAIIIFGCLIPLFLFWISGAEVNYADVISNITGNTTFPDAHIATAHSGIYALVVLFQDAHLLHSVDRDALIKACMRALPILLATYLGLEFFLRKIKKVAFLRKDLCLGSIAIFVIMKLLHQNNADMNYVLLLPLLSVLFIEKLDLIERLIFACTLLFLFPFYVFNLYACFYEDIPGRAFNYYFSIRTPVFTSSLFLITALSYMRMFKILRTPRLSA